MQQEHNIFDPVRQIVKKIHKKRRRISGGTGKKERYEMRDTPLYYELGKVILEIASKNRYQGEDKQNLISQIGNILQKEFDDNENIVRWAVRFVESFDEKQFKEISKLCRNSLGQLREITDILDNRNRLEIKNDDIKIFKKEYASLETYDERRKLCTQLKRKYSQGGADIDFIELQENFDFTDRTVRNVLDGTVDDRKKLRESLGSQFIQNLRYLCMLLSREETFSTENSRKIIKKLVKSKPAKDLSDKEISSLYLNFKKFLVLNSGARDGLRGRVSPYSMTLLQKMLLAIQSEDDFKDYQSTGELFKSIGI